MKKVFQETSALNHLEVCTPGAGQYTYEAKAFEEKCKELLEKKWS